MVSSLQKKIKTFFLTLSFFIITYLLLTFPKESLYFSFTGLQLWFNKMIPTLLPFMILTGVMIRLNLTENFVRILNPFLKPILNISLNGIYVVVVGFLCGFPMGAKVIADLYLQNKISEKEASFLLSFCNNIGPIYFMSFVLPVLGLHKKTPYIFGMYGLPFLYGIFLRHTIYKNDFKVQLHENSNDNSFHKSRKYPIFSAEVSGTFPLLDALDESIISGLYSISKLGGYMILFNLLNLIPQAIMNGNMPGNSIGLDFNAILNCLLEITSGINRMGTSAPLIVLLLLPFGGFSCIAQTYSMIKETNLSLKKYIIHKLVLTIITILYYGGWHLLSPATFLI